MRYISFTPRDLQSKYDVHFVRLYTLIMRYLLLSEIHAGTLVLVCISWNDTYANDSVQLITYAFNSNKQALKHEYKTNHQKL